MSSKLIFVVLAIACFAAVALSASIKEEGLWENLWGMKQVCDICQKVVDRVKQSGQIEQLKQQLESLCTMISDPKKADDCMKKIDQYVSDIETKTPLDVCKEFKLCQ